MSNFDAAWETLGPLVENMRELQALAAQHYQPVVEALVGSRSRDVKQIEHTLDGLLDFCDHAPVLAMYQQLCRHYRDIDPQATACYVQSYRERWDSEVDEGHA